MRYQLEVVLHAGAGADAEDELAEQVLEALLEACIQIDDADGVSIYPIY